MRNVLLILFTVSAAWAQYPIPGENGGGAGSGAVSSVTAGPTGALTCTPTTGAVVCDVDTAYVPNKAGAAAITGTWDFTGGSLLIPSLTAIGALPYVTATGILGDSPMSVTNHPDHPDFSLTGSQEIMTFGLNGDGSGVSIGANNATVTAGVDFTFAAPSFSFKSWDYDNLATIADTGTATFHNETAAGSTLVDIVAGAGQTTKSVVLQTGGRITAPLTTPTTSGETCAAGTFTADTSYVYVCTSANTWKRAALSAF